MFPGLSGCLLSGFSGSAVGTEAFIQCFVEGFQEYGLSGCQNSLYAENAAACEEPKEVIEYAHGITELSQKIGCCQSTIYMLKKEGVLDDAIVSQVGRKIIFNVGKARALADEYQRAQRESRRENQ